MTARDELAKVLAEADPDPYMPAGNWDSDAYYGNFAGTLLASPVFARLIREAKAESWDEGYEQGYPDGRYTETTPNPYEKENAE